MRINGRNRLACKTLLKDLDTTKPITVEPIKGLPVEKDSGSWSWSRSPMANPSRVGQRRS